MADFFGRPTPPRRSAGLSDEEIQQQGLGDSPFFNPPQPAGPPPAMTMRDYGALADQMRQRGMSDEQVEQEFQRYYGMSPPAEGMAGEFGRGVVRGAYGSVGAVGRAFGQDEFAERMAEAAADPDIAPMVQGMSDIDGISDAGRWVASLAGESAPEMAAIAAGAALTGGGAAVAGAGLAARTAAGYAGGMAASTPAHAGRNIAEQMGHGVAPEDVDQVAAWGTAGVQGALDAVVPSMLVARLGLAPAKARRVSRTLLDASKQVGKRTGVDILEEAGTEAAQEALSVLQADPDGVGALFTPAVGERLLESAVAGGVLGGTFGAPASAVEVTHQQRAVNMRQRGIDAARVARLEEEGRKEEAEAARQELLSRGYTPEMIESLGESERLARMATEARAATAAEQLTMQAGLPDVMVGLPEGDAQKRAPRYIPEPGRPERPALDAMSNVGLPEPELKSESERRARIKTLQSMEVNLRSQGKTGRTAKQREALERADGVAEEIAQEYQAIETQRRSLGPQQGLTALPAPGEAGTIIPPAPDEAPWMAETRRRMEAEDRRKELERAERAAATADVMNGIDEVAAGAGVVPEEWMKDAVTRQTLPAIQEREGAALGLPPLPTGEAPSLAETEVPAAVEAAPSAEPLEAESGGSSAEGAPPTVPTKTPPKTEPLPEPAERLPEPIKRPEPAERPEMRVEEVRPGRWEAYIPGRTRPVGHLTFDDEGNPRPVVHANVMGDLRDQIRQQLEERAGELQRPATVEEAPPREGQEPTGEQAEASEVGAVETARTEPTLDIGSPGLEQPDLLGGEPVSAEELAFQQDLAEMNPPDDVDLAEWVPANMKGDVRRQARAARRLAVRRGQTPLGFTEGTTLTGRMDTVSPETQAVGFVEDLEAAVRSRLDTDRGRDVLDDVEITIDYPLDEFDLGHRIDVTAKGRDEPILTTNLDDPAEIERLLTSDGPAAEASTIVDYINAEVARQDEVKRKAIEEEEQAEIAAEEAEQAVAADVEAEIVEEAETPTEEIEGTTTGELTPETFADLANQARIGLTTKDKRAPAKFMEAVYEATGLDREDAAQRRQAEATAEAAMSSAIADIVAEERAAGTGDRVIFERLAEMYGRMPKSETKTGMRAVNQEFSTPPPIAFAMGEAIGLADYSRVYDPTIGTGMLVVDAGRNAVRGREISDVRLPLARLMFGERVQNVDALSPDPPLPVYDAAMMNPPFGGATSPEQKPMMVMPRSPDRVAEGDGQRVKWNRIDQAIAWRTLNGLPADGRAAIILGSGKPQEDRGTYYAQQRPFFDNLYRYYNVRSHVTGDSKLFSRMGAQWPIEIITIDGRRETPIAKGEPSGAPTAETLPPMLTRMEEVWDALVEQPGRPGRPSGTPTTEQPGAAPGDGGRPGAEVGEGGDTPGSGAPDSERVAGPERTGEGPGRPGVEGVERPTTEGQPPASGTEPGVGEEAGGAPGRSPELGGVGVEDVGAGSLDTARPDQTAETPNQPTRTKAQQEVDLDPITENEVRYVPASTKGRRLGSLEPRTLAPAQTSARAQLRRDVGNVDDFLMNRLGYASREEYDKALAAEQRDGVALAIRNFEQGDGSTGIVIGDQTGIGKGRQVAALLRYAKGKGLVPIFVTEKTNLYGDMMRDLRDIGSPDWKVLVTDSNLHGASAIEVEDGDPITSVGKTPVAHLKAMKAAGKDWKKAGYDAVFTTYAQMNTVAGKEPPRRQFVEALAPNALVIMDESHNAGGTGLTWDEVVAKAQAKDKTPVRPRELFFRDLVKSARHVAFSSATWAKRVQTISLYEPVTGIRDITGGEFPLKVFERGGVAMQQAVTSLLARAGQYIRRERSFYGVEVDTDTVYETNREVVDDIADGLAQIRAFDEMYGKKLREDARQAAGARGGGKQGKVDKAIADVEFASVMHNLLDQSFTALRARQVADEAIAALEAGQKPVIAVANTAEGMIKELAETEGVELGGEVTFGVNTLMQRYLARTLRYSVKDPTDPDSDKVVHEWIDVDALPEDAREAYDDAMTALGNIGVGEVPGSTIDAIRARLEARGYRVGEITGRSTRIDYEGDTDTGKLTARPPRDSKPAGRRSLIARFNGGSLARPVPEEHRIDALILNQSGATGVSVHAGEGFADQRQRTMIVAQPEKNIDTFVQMLGRVHRTGQVTPPRFIIPSSDIPAELRMHAVLKRKLISLQANVSATGKGQVDVNRVPDFMNALGSQAAADVLAGEEDFADRMGIGLPEASSLTDDSFIRRVTGRVALLPIADQERFYDTLVDVYNEEVAQKKAMGEAVGAMTVMPLNATAKRRQLIIPGDGKTPFTAPTYATEIETDILSPAPEYASVTKEIERNTPAVELDDWQRQSMSDLEQLRQRGMERARELARPVHEVEVPGAIESIRQRSKMQENVKEKKIKELRQTWNATRGAISNYAPGQNLTLIKDGMNVPGIVTNIARKGRGASWSQGSWEVTIALASNTTPRLRTTLSKITTVNPYETPSEETIALASNLIRLPANERATQGEQDSLQGDFDTMAAQGREGRMPRVALLGNVPRAYFLAQQGQLVQITDHTGNVGEALLMPDGIETIADTRRVQGRLQSSRELREVLHRLPTATVTFSSVADLRKDYDGNLVFVVDPTQGSKKWRSRAFLDSINSDPRKPKLDFSKGIIGFSGQWALVVPADRTQDNSVWNAISQWFAQADSSQFKVEGMGAQQAINEVKGLPEDAVVEELDPTTPVFQLDKDELEDIDESVPEIEADDSRVSEGAPENEPDRDPDSSPGAASPGGELTPEEQAAAATAARGKDQKRKRSKAEREKIEDVGEKIGGARKDQWAGRGLAVTDLEEMTEAERATFVTRDQVWPESDWQGMIDDGADPLSLAIRRRLRMNLPKTPVVVTHDVEESQRLYVEAVGMVRDALMEGVPFQTGGVRPPSYAFDDVIRDPAYLRGIDWRHQTTIQGRRISRNTTATHPDVTADHRGYEKAVDAAVVDVMSGWPNPGPWKDSIKAKRKIKDRPKILAGDTDLETAQKIAFMSAPDREDALRLRGYIPTSPMSMQVYQDKIDVAVRRDWAGDPTQTPSVQLGFQGKPILEERGPLPVAEAAALLRRWFFERFPGAYAKWELGIKPAGEAVGADPWKRPEIDEVNRIGDDVRAGKDVTGDDFVAAFGFRAVEFGNWVNQTERQESMNHAFDALHDMASAVGISPQALSLDGKLALAFGSRGRGGHVAAHYEPGRVVINLTKTSGSGSLAHEFGHALAHYLNQWSAVDAAGGRDLPGISVPADDVPVGQDSRWVARTPDAMAPELREAVRDVVGTLIASSPGTAEEALKLEAQIENAKGEIAKAQRYNESWASSTVSPRKKKNAIEQNNLYIKRMEGRLEVMQEKHAKAIEGIPSGDQYITDFYRKAINKTGSGAKGYWARPEELWARAFETYVRDRIEAKGGRSDYLVTLGHSNAYPIGHERETINRAFDNLIARMRERENEADPYLYRRPAPDEVRPMSTTPAIDDLRADLERMGLDDVAVRFSADLADMSGNKVQGRYLDKVIEIGADSIDTLRTFGHEAMEAMISLGVISDADLPILLAHGRANRAKYQIDQRYAGLDEATMDKEAAAEAFADYYQSINREAEAPGPVRRIYDRMVRFLESFRNWIDGYGFRNAHDVFQEAVNGALGANQRQPRGAPGAVYRRPDYVAPPPAGSARRLYDGLSGRVVSKAWWAGEGLPALARTFVDQFDPVKRAEIRIKGRTTSAETSAYKAVEMAIQDSGRWSVALENGALAYRDGRVVVRPGTKGLKQVFKPVERNQAAADDLQAYFYATRAARLKKEGRERLMSDADIRDGLAMRGKWQAQGIDFEAIRQDYQAFNEGMMDFLVETGVLNEDTRDAYTEHGDYVPFYRMFEEDQTLISPSELRKGLSNPDPRIKKLLGGEARLGDLYTNISKNTRTLLSAGMRNVAMARTRDLLTGAGESTDVKAHEKKTVNGKPDTTVSYFVDGKKTWFRPDDPTIAVALAGMRPEQFNGIVKAMQTIARIVRGAITIAPSFMLANLIRGSTAGFVQTGENATRQHNTVTGLISALRNTPELQALQAATGTGGFRFGMESDWLTGDLARDLGVRNEARVVGWMRRTYESMERIGEATEMADRIAIQQNLIAKGVDPAEAAYQAMNLINYSRHGNSRALRMLTTTVPFLNARIQGLYRMAETQGKTGVLKGVLLRGLLLTAVSSGLYALRIMMGDDERYEEEPLERRLNYEIFYSDMLGTKILVPKAFEFGAIFQTLPMAVVDAFRRESGSKELAATMAMTFANTFAFNPVPAALLPVLEVATNFDTFTGRPIESMGAQRLQAAERIRYDTTFVARGIGDVMGGLEGVPGISGLGLSPVQAQHLIDGYGGVAAAVVIGGIEAVLSSVGATTPKPARTFGDIPIVSGFGETLAGRFFRPIEGDPASGMVNQMYELRDDANRVFKTAKELSLRGEVEEANELIAAHRGAVRSRKLLNQVARKLTEVNRRIRAIRTNRNLDGGEKADLLRPLTDLKKALAKSGVRQALQAG